MAQPIFHYDFNSPYAYLAAHRVDEVLPEPPRWAPIAFGPLLRDIGKVPWSFTPGPDRDARRRECEERAAALGLPLRWPEGWPFESYSLAPLRGALVAEDHGRVREFSLLCFGRVLGEGRALLETADVVALGVEAGVLEDAMAAGLEDPAIKARLRAVTDEAREAGVTGIPTVRVGDELFWGDDRLEDAARAL